MVGCGCEVVGCGWVGGVLWCGVEGGRSHCSRVQECDWLSAKPADKTEQEPTRTRISGKWRKSRPWPRDMGACHVEKSSRKSPRGGLNKRFLEVTRTLEAWLRTSCRLRFQAAAAEQQRLEPGVASKSSARKNGSEHGDQDCCQRHRRTHGHDVPACPGKVSRPTPLKAA